MKAFYEKKSPQILLHRTTDLTFPLHLHKEIEFLYCLEGALTITYQNQTKTLIPNEFFIVLPNVIHSYETKQNSVAFMCIVSIDYLPLFKKYFSKELSVPFLESSDAILLFPQFQAFEQEFLTYHRMEVLIGHISIILGTAFSCFTFTEKMPLKYDDILPDLLSYLDEHFRTNLCADDIALHFGLNPSYLSRFVSTRLNCTLTRYIHELRINYAKHLLDTSTLPITQIAFACGFSTQRSFNRVFTSILTVTPREYRNLKNCSK